MTASKTENQEQLQPQGTQLSPQQIQAAAQAGIKLIAEGRVNVPSDMAMNGTLGVLNATLTSLAQGSTILASPAVIKELQDKVEAAEKKPVKTPRKKAPAKNKAANTKR